MPDYNFPSTADVLLRAGATAVGNIMNAHTARQLNQFEVSASAARFDFFTALAQDRDTITYVTKLEEGLFAAYDELAEGLENPMVRQKVTTFLNTKKEEDRQAAIKLGQRNAQVYGAEELITGLDAILSRSPGADESLLGDETHPSYQQSRLKEMYGNIARAYAGGIIDQERASQLSRDYTQAFMEGHSRYLAYNAARLLIQGKSSVAETTDLLVQVARSGGGALEDIINMSEISIDPDAEHGPGMKVISAEALGHLGAYAQAYANVTLTPEQKESLVTDIERESKRLSGVFSAQAKEKLLFNDLELSKLWATEDGRRKMMANGFAMLYSVFDASTPEGRTEIAKWQKDLGDWDYKITVDGKQEDAKRKWDIEIQRILRVKDLSAIDQTISDIQNDKEILDAERDSMVSNLNLMKTNLQKEGVVVDAEGVEFDPEPVRAEYDAKILAVTLDAINGVSGVATKITNLAKEIEQHTYFKGNEQDRNERTGKLMTLLKDLGSKAVGTVSAKSNIADMFSDPAYSEKEIRDAIRKAELADEITGDEANTLYNRLDTRAEVHLGDKNAKGAIATVNRYFYSRVNVADIEPEEAALLAQEQMTADNALNDLIDSKEYRAMTKVQQKEQIDLIMKDILDPVITRSFAQKVLGLAGLGGDEKRPDKYSQFQTIDSPSYSASLFAEIKTEWATQLQTEFSNLNPNKMQAKRTLVDGKYIIELLHTPSGAMLTQRNGKWWVKWPGDTDYTEVKNRALGEDTKKRLEAIRG